MLQSDCQQHLQLCKPIYKVLRKDLTVCQIYSSVRYRNKGRVFVSSIVMKVLRSVQSLLMLILYTHAQEAILAEDASVLYQDTGMLSEDTSLIENIPQVTSQALEQAVEVKEKSLEQAQEAETLSVSIGSCVIFVTGMAMLGIIGYVVYRQHKRNAARDEDNQMLKSLLDSEMDYAAM
ncbi:hypothetical protein AC1031_019699 [Aphanomyces cochlioides]|nr:hypothetical protein AC1031_019699 [Aphanomyces cochlioides]